MNPGTPHTSRMIDVGHIALHVTTYEGHGPALLLIHGISSNGEGWNPVIDELATHFSPITVDLRGHGKSDKPESGYLYDDYIGDIEQLLLALNLEHPLIVGHSLGGILTLWWAAKHPSQGRALVIEDSPLRSGEEFRPAFENWLKLNAMTLPDLAEHYAAENPDWSAELVQSRARAMTTTKRAVFQELMQHSMANEGVDRISEITAITSPVLLVHGDYETGSMVQPDDIEALPNRLPNAQTVRIPGGDHTLHRSSKDAFLATAVPFLLKHAGERSPGS